MAVRTLEEVNDNLRRMWEDRIPRPIDRMRDPLGEHPGLVPRGWVTETAQMHDVQWTAEPPPPMPEPTTEITSSTFDVKATMAVVNDLTNDQWGQLCFAFSRELNRTLSQAGYHVTIAFDNGSQCGTNPLRNNPRIRVDLEHTYNHAERESAGEAITDAAGRSYVFDSNPYRLRFNEDGSTQRVDPRANPPVTTAGEAI